MYVVRIARILLGATQFIGLFCTAVDLIGIVSDTGLGRAGQGSSAIAKASLSLARPAFIRHFHVLARPWVLMASWCWLSYPAESACGQCSPYSVLAPFAAPSHASRGAAFAFDNGRLLLPLALAGGRLL